MKKLGEDILHKFSEDNGEGDKWRLRKLKISKEHRQLKNSLKDKL